MIRMRIKNGVKAAGLFLAGVSILTLGYGFSFTNGAVEMWRKVGQTIQPVPSTLSLSVASTTATSLKVGSSATRLTNLLAGTCNLTGMDTSQTATTSAAYDCAITGVQTNDFVFVGQATTTPTTNLGWRVAGANASSTNGYITVHILNLTGGDAVPSATNAGSSTPYFILR